MAVMPRKLPRTNVTVNCNCGDTDRVTNEAGGVKADGNKTRWDLMPLGALDEIARVLTYGANKYSDDNWRKVEVDRYWGAMFRHLVAARCGEELDGETGERHLSHAGCCLLFIMELMKEGKK